MTNSAWIMCGTRSRTRLGNERVADRPVLSGGVAFIEIEFYKIFVSSFIKNSHRGRAYCKSACVVIIILSSHCHLYAVK